MAVASFVLGIISFVCCYFPIVNFIFLFTALLSIIFGIAALIGNKKAEKAGQQSKNNSFPVIGIILSVVSILIIMVVNLVLLNFIDSFSLDNIDKIVNKFEQYTDDIDFDFDVDTNRGKIIIEPDNKNTNTQQEVTYEPLKAIEESSEDYYLGQTFENSALAFSIIDFNTSYSVNNSSAVSTNKKVVQLTIKVQNLLDREVEFNSSSIHVKDDDSVDCHRYYSNSNKGEEYLTGSLAPHSTKVITLQYSIPKTTKHLTVKYDMYPISYDVVSFVLDNN